MENPGKAAEKAYKQFTRGCQLELRGLNDSYQHNHPHWRSQSGRNARLASCDADFQQKAKLCWKSEWNTAEVEALSNWTVI